MVKVDIVWNLQNIIAVLFAIVGAFLLIMSFFTDPAGQIDSTIEFVIGEIFAFISACLGIDSYYRSKLKDIEKKQQQLQ